MIRKWSACDIVLVYRKSIVIDVQAARAAWTLQHAAGCALTE